MTKRWRFRLTFDIEHGELEPPLVEGEPAVGIVIDPHRWDEPDDEDD